MVKVIFNYYGKKSERSLKHLIAESLDRDDSDMGAVESAAYTARRSSIAVSELIELLVAKEVITINEALRLIGREHDDITLSGNP